MGLYRLSNSATAMLEYEFGLNKSAEFIADREI